MELHIARNRQTGFRYYYSVRTFCGDTRYTANCSWDCVGKNALKKTWHYTIGDARRAAEQRSTLPPVQS